MFLNQLKSFARLSALRQTLALLGLFAGISILAWGGTFWLVQREMTAAVDARLTTRMQAALIALDAGQSLPPAIDGQSAKLTSGARDGFRTIDPDSHNLPQYRYLSRTTPYGQITLGENTERQEELRDLMAGGMLVMLTITLLGTLLAGLWMARRGQARLDVINAGLAEVAKGRLDRPILLHGPSDDLSLLADRINATTTRLDQVMEQMRVQSSNIAHDLRTPLARLRAQLETKLFALTEQQRAVTADDLGAALEQIDQITGTFNALLRLSRIESGAGRAGFAPVDLGRLAQQTVETFGPVAEDAGHLLKLDMSTPATVNGDRDLLVQLLANLIQNALRYGAEGQTITLRVHGPRISISDQGPGIPFAEREKVLVPLYQGETTRQNAGFGLGLAMVHAICELHDAGLSLSDAPGGGLCVTVQFPT